MCWWGSGEGMWCVFVCGGGVGGDEEAVRIPEDSPLRGSELSRRLQLLHIIVPGVNRRSA